MDEGNTPKRKNVGPGGPLYDLLMEKLPQYQIVHGEKKLGIYKLAEDAGISAQHLYITLSRKSGRKLPYTTARKLIDCSEKQTDLPKDFKPLTLLDLEPFMPS